MKVSVITVSFNSAVTIRDTIESVLGQDHPEIEYIIVDGESKDGTMDIVEEYKGHIGTIISEPDHGIYDAMNKGIRAATGDVVCMLNSDDVYAGPTAVRELMERLQYSGADTVFADLVVVDPADTERVVRYYESSRFRVERLRYGWMPAHPTFLAKRSLFEQWGLYSLDYRIAADYEMMVRLLYRAGVSYAYLPRVAVKMRAGGVSTSGVRSSWLLNNEIVRACRENGLDTNLLLVLL
ncbi:glycosyltransferase family 2 protein, partial [Thioalkalivibrio sp. AKL7]|uniref:glycosyltransferase family 2 protein n=1 Tax=Thioalkalivibrio sp. AKL7 TaxID=1158155 RepID=UPI00037A8ADA